MQAQSSAMKTNLDHIVEANRVAANTKIQYEEARIRKTELNTSKEEVAPAISALVDRASFAVITRDSLRWSYKHEPPVKLGAVVQPVQHDIHRLKCGASGTPVAHNQNSANIQFFTPYGIAAKRCAKDFGFREREACMKLAPRVRMCYCSFRLKVN